MPAIAPSYIYAFFALITVSGILISSYGAYTATLRAIPEVEQMENLLNHVAAKGYELITLTTATNSTSDAVLQLPSTIGNKHYWVRLRNESSETWVEGALGSIHEYNIANRAYLPKAVSVFGEYSSESGSAFLECYMNSSTVNLRLSSWRENV